MAMSTYDHLDEGTLESRVRMWRPAIEYCFKKSDVVTKLAQHGLLDAEETAKLIELYDLKPSQDASSEMFNILFRKRVPKRKWKTFVDAIEEAGYTFAVSRLINERVEIAEERERGKQLLLMFGPFFEIDVNPSLLIDQLLDRKIIKEEDADKIRNTTHTKSKAEGMRILLQRIQCYMEPRKWWQEFLTVLWETEFEHMALLLEPEYFPTSEKLGTCNLPVLFQVRHCANCNTCNSMLLCSNCKGVSYCSRHCQKRDWNKHKRHCNLSTSFKTDSQSSNNHDQEANGICAFCQRVGAQRCAQCKSASYCTRVCQAADWKRHKPECKRKCTDQQTAKMKPEKDVDDPTIDRLSINEPKSFDKPKQDLVTPGKVDMLLASEYDSGNTKVSSTNSTSTKTNMHKKGVKDNQTRTDETTEGASNCKLDNANEFKDPKSGNCNRCNIMGCTQKCARCRSIFYCSKPCQKEDWAVHKKSCKKEYTDEDKRIIEERLKRKKQQAIDLQKMEKDKFVSLFDTFSGGNERFLKTLSPEKALLTASRPHGSLQKAIEFAEAWFPDLEVLTRFSNVSRLFMNVHKYVLVAFMYRYHEHVMRHGAYLKDDMDSESKVEFYLDHVADNPAPFFTYSMVRPGNYKCIVRPLVHAFMDGTTGFKIEDPSYVCIIEKDMLLQENSSFRN